MSRGPKRPEDYISVSRAQLSRMVGKLTYPQHCLHARGDATVCPGCQYTWERRAMEVRDCLLVLCKYKQNIGTPQQERKP